MNTRLSTYEISMVRRSWPWGQDQQGGGIMLRTKGLLLGRMKSRVLWGPKGACPWTMIGSSLWRSEDRSEVNREDTSEDLSIYTHSFHSLETLS
jgi:hypothetical protein